MKATAHLHTLLNHFTNALRYLFYEPRLPSIAIHANKIAKYGNPSVFRQNKVKPNIKKAFIVITAAAINSFAYAELVISSIEYTLKTLFYITFTPE